MSKTAFLSKSKELGIHPKVFGPKLREVSAALLLQDPDLPLNPDLFRSEVEGLLENPLKRLKNQTKRFIIKNGY